MEDAMVVSDLLAPIHAKFVDEMPSRYGQIER